MINYPTVNNADLEFLYTPQCKVRNSSYEFAMRSKNKILRGFSSLCVLDVFVLAIVRFPRYNYFCDTMQKISFVISY